MENNRIFSKNVFLIAAVFLGVVISEHISVEENAAAYTSPYTGKGLRSIAQGSANQAHSAVAQQHAAAQQASFLATSTLAQTAIQAAATAQAALAGKQVLLHTLEEQTSIAHDAYKSELIQLRLAKQAAATAHAAAQKLGGHVNLLTSALNSAQEAGYRAEETAGHSAAELASQESMVETAKSKFEAIQKELHHVRVDFEATKDAAEKASSSALEAQNNAAEAGVKASIGLHEAAAAHIEGDYSNSVDIESHDGSHK